MMFVRSVSSSHSFFLCFVGLLGLVSQVYSATVHSSFTTREEIVEVVNRLFYYTDTFDWVALKEEVFTDVVSFAAGPINDQVDAADMTAQEVVDQWDSGLANIEHVIHLAGNHIVTMTNNNTEATVICYAQATHYNHSLTRDFVGSYDLGLTITENGWSMNSFRYNLMFLLGSLTPMEDVGVSEPSVMMEEEVASNASTKPSVVTSILAMSFTSLAVSMI